MYEKKKIPGKAEGEENADSCTICNRPKNVVYCRSCSYRLTNMRRRRACSKHPKELFLMDLCKCPSCKSDDLCEVGIDDESSREDREGSESEAGMSTQNCPCMRPLYYVMCNVCGYYKTGLRKFIPCPVHPQAKNGVMECPDCEADLSSLDDGNTQ